MSRKEKAVLYRASLNTMGYNQFKSGVTLKQLNSVTVKLAVHCQFVSRFLKFCQNKYVV